MARRPVSGGCACCYRQPALITQRPSCLPPCLTWAACPWACRSPSRSVLVLVWPGGRPREPGQVPCVAAACTLPASPLLPLLPLQGGCMMARCGSAHSEQGAIAALQGRLPCSAQRPSGPLRAQIAAVRRGSQACACTGACCRPACRLHASTPRDAPCVLLLRCLPLQKADIWSCGVLLYAMVTDCYPFS